MCRARIRTRSHGRIRAGCQVRSFALALCLITLEADTTVGVAPARAFVADTSLADVNWLKPRLAARIAYVAPRKGMITHFRVVVLATIQRLFTIRYVSANESEEACENCEEACAVPCAFTSNVKRESWIDPVQRGSTRGPTRVSCGAHIPTVWRMHVLNTEGLSMIITPRVSS
jgi:hypothetical protein